MSSTCCFCGRDLSQDRCVSVWAGRGVACNDAPACDQDQAKVMKPMKLCQKCIDEVIRVQNEGYETVSNDSPYKGLEQVGVASSEAECQFWIHQKYNQLRTDMETEEAAEL